MERKTSIIIVIFNAYEYVKKCLESVLDLTDKKHEIIIIDNMSDALTRDYIKSFRENNRIQIILNNNNRLWLPAVNQGLEASSNDSEYCLLLNSDIEVFDKAWIQRLQKPMLENVSIGITGTHYNFLPIKPSYGAIDGCCFMFRRKLINRLGHFDDNYPWNGAPYIYTQRAWKAELYYYHIKDHSLLVHHGKKSRLENKIQINNSKIDYYKVIREAGLIPSFDLFAKVSNKLNLFNINSQIKKLF